MASRGQDSEHQKGNNVLTDDEWRRDRPNGEPHVQPGGLSEVPSTVQQSASRMRPRRPSDPPTRLTELPAGTTITEILEEQFDDRNQCHYVCRVTHVNNTTEIIIMQFDYLIRYDTESMIDEYVLGCNKPKGKAPKKRKMNQNRNSTANRGRPMRGHDGTPTAPPASSGANVLTPGRHQSNEEEVDDAASTDKSVGNDTTLVAQTMFALRMNHLPSTVAEDAPQGVHTVTSPREATSTPSSRAIAPELEQTSPPSGGQRAEAYNLVRRTSDNNGTEIPPAIDTGDAASHHSSDTSEITGTEEPHNRPSTDELRALEAIPFKLTRLYGKLDGLLHGAGGESRGEELGNWLETFQVTRCRLQGLLRDRTTHDRLFNWRSAPRGYLEDFIMDVNVILHLFGKGEAHPPNSLRQ